jgi:hypothetical protein
METAMNNKVKDEMLDAAMVLISNANGGDWTKQSPEWVVAAERWRGQYLATAAGDGFTKYRRSQIAELRPYVAGEDLAKVSIASVDMEAGSPKVGDMIARNPKNHADQWLVAAKYFADNFEACQGSEPLL